jgi:hypothetical protein
MNNKRKMKKKKGIYIYRTSQYGKMFMIGESVGSEVRGLLFHSL